jgi:hypothetical protein
MPTCRSGWRSRWRCGALPILPIRKDKSTLFDFRKLEIKSLWLEPIDAVMVDQAGVVEGGIRAESGTILITENSVSGLVRKLFR